MKNISRLYSYPDEFFAGRIPESAVNVRPRQDSDYPVFIRENLLSVEQCRFIANQFVASGANDTPGTRGANRDVTRRVYSFALSDGAKVIYEHALRSVTPSLVDFFGVIPIASSGAHGLGYTPGCKYDLHSDNCDADYDSAGNFLGYRHSQPARHLSTLLFLSDSVEELGGDFQHIGGNLSFRFLLDDQNEHLLVEPKCGLFIAFPSDPVYAHEVHEVHEVSSGFRFAIVDWHTCRVASAGAR